jgi:8-oxo-dGTP diphosphatase
MIDVENTNIGTHVLLITKDGKLILQQRDANPKIINPGLISMFGGTIRVEEDLVKGLERELMEELELDISKGYSIRKLGTYYKTKKEDNIDYTINVFTIRNIELKKLKLHEGAGYIVNFPNNLVTNSKLTRITKLALEDYIKTENASI